MRRQIRSGLGVVLGMLLALAAAGALAAELVDINSATPEELKTVPGITEGTALLITGGRPYQKTDELVSRQILTKEQFDKIKDGIVAKAVKKEKPKPAVTP
jgi:competence protein ComEA